MCPDGTEPEAPGAPKYCTNCGTRLLPGSNFCTACGMPQGPNAAPRPIAQYTYPAPRLNSLREIIMTFGAYGAIALAALMVVNVVIAIWGIDLVLPHLDRHIYLFIITPFIVNFAELGGGAFLGYYIFLVAAIVASFAWMIYKSIGPLTDELRAVYPKAGHSPLYTISTVILAVLSFNVIYYLVIESLGATTNTPTFETRELWQLIYGFAAASVWEEIVSRVLLVGIPLLLIDGLLRVRNPEYQMKKLPSYILGGGFTIGRKEAVLMVFSSIMFGVAHLASWDLFKIFPAAVAGLAFAFLYLKLGLYASIMMHFAIDFMSVPLSVWPDSLAVTMTLGLLLLAWLAIGVPNMVLYFSKGLGWLLGRRIWPDLPPKAPEPVYVGYYPVYAPAPMYPAPQSAPPAPYGGVPTNQAGDERGYVCNNCGNREAVYTEGNLVCTRCGSKR